MSSSANSVLVNDSLMSIWQRVSRETATYFDRRFCTG
jgi:hypothetical protein